MRAEGASQAAGSQKGTAFIYWAAAITLGAAFFHFFQLDRYPVGFYFDEAANAIDLSRLGRDFHPIFFTANNGREPLFFYWAAIFMRALTVTPFSLRVAGAFAGVLGVPATYFCISQVLRKAEGSAMSRRVALFASAGCAVLFFQLMFSRYGLRTITLPLFECLSLGLLWQAARLRSLWRFLVGGVLLAACLYTYTAARLLIPGLAVYALYRLIEARGRIDWAGWTAAGASFIVAATPLGLYAFTHQADFFQRSGTIAVTDRASVLRSFLAIAEMFVIRGSDQPFQNIAYMPVFDVVMGAAFLIGIVLLIPRLRHPGYVFLLIWFLSIVPASAFSPSAPYYLRLTGLIPPMLVLPALTLAELPALVRRLSPGWAFAPSIAVVLASVGFTFYHYFAVWGPSREAFYAAMQDKVDGAAQIRQRADSGKAVFLARLYAQDWTYIWLTRGEPVQSFQATDCTVLPPAGQEAVYAFPYFDKDQPPALLAQLPGRPTVTTTSNSRGEPLLTVIDEPASSAAPKPVQANFGNQLGLLAVNGLPSSPLHPGGTIDVTLDWRGLSKMTADYVVFLHADDNANHRRIQRDTMPCNATFLTSWWTPGEEVDDRYSLAIPSDAPDGTYDLTVGAYELPAVRNLAIEGSGVTELKVGSVRVTRGG